MGTGPVATRWDSTPSRLPGPLRRDALLAAVVAVAMPVALVAVVGLLPADDAPSPARLPWVLLAVVVQALALVLRRVRLRVYVAVTVGTQIALVALAPDLSVRPVAPFVVAATVGTALPAGRALRLAGAGGGGAGTRRAGAQGRGRP